MNSRNRRLLLIVLATFAVVAAACGSEGGANSAPAAQANPTPVPTASPIAFVPITVDLDNDPAAFLDAIPEADRACLEDEWGSDRYQAIRSGNERLGDETLGLFPCLAGDTLLRIMVGGITAEIGELTATTRECVVEKLREGSVSAIVRQVSELGAQPSLEEFAEIAIQMISETIPVTFCLNEDERAIMDAQNQFGASISTLECLYDGAESLGLDFSSVFQIAPSDFEPPAEYLQVATDCGFDIPEAPPTPDPDARRRTIGTPPPSPSLTPVVPTR